MIGQRVNRGDPERLFMVFKANEANMAKDDTAVLELTAGSADGVAIAQPAAADLWAFVGVLDAAIASGEYGLVQVYGYRSTSRVFTQATNSMAAGVPLIPVDAADYFASFVSVATVSGHTHYGMYAVLMESVASSSATGTISAKIFLRAM